MADKYILGIDVGTTSVKAGLIGSTGNIVSLYVNSYETIRPGNRVVEQNADDWVRLIEEAVNQFASEGHVENTTSVGLCSQVNTHVFVEADGEPLMPAIMWQDGRATTEAAELDACISDAQKCAWWGAPMPIDASHALPRMLWVIRNRADVWEKTKWVMLPKDYCTLKLTGEVATDPLSNVGLVNNQLDYISELFDLVPGAMEKMAPLVAVTEVAGTVRRGTPLAGRPLVCGTMDAWAGLVGTGGAKEGSSVYLSGTSEIIGISSSKVVATSGAIVFPNAHDIRLHAAPTQSGGDAKMWFSELAGLTLDEMSKLVSQTPRSSSTPLFLPQLEGERAPLWDTNLRAVFLGLARNSGLGDMARAVYEGVAFSARFALETLQASADTVSDHITCGGGGFRSDVWAQIRADILGVELKTSAADEPGVLGAVTIASVGSGQYASFADAHDVLAVYGRVFEPNLTEHKRYSQMFELYKEAITANAALNKRLSTLGS